jgi:hypothetical protein
MRTLLLCLSVCVASTAYAQSTRVTVKSSRQGHRAIERDVKSAYKFYEGKPTVRAWRNPFTGTTTLTIRGKHIPESFRTRVQHAAARANEGSGDSRQYLPNSSALNGM